MGAHSLGQFHHFNIATRTRLRMDAEELEWRRELIKRMRKQIEEEKPDVVTVIEKPSWWTRLWQWMKRIAKGAE